MASPKLLYALQNYSIEYSYFLKLQSNARLFLIVDNYSYLVNLEENI